MCVYNKFLLNCGTSRPVHHQLMEGLQAPFVCPSPRFTSNGANSRLISLWGMEREGNNSSLNLRLDRKSFRWGNSRVIFPAWPISNSTGRIFTELSRSDLRESVVFPLVCIYCGTLGGPGKNPPPPPRGEKLLLGLS